MCVCLRAVLLTICLLSIQYVYAHTQRHTNIHTRRHTHTHKDTHKDTHTKTHQDTQRHKDTQRHTKSHTHTHTKTHEHAHTQRHTHKGTKTQTQRHKDTTHRYKDTQTQTHTHTHSHTHTHTHRSSQLSACSDHVQDNARLSSPRRPACISVASTARPVSQCSRCGSGPLRVLGQNYGQFSVDLEAPSKPTVLRVARIFVNLLSPVHLLPPTPVSARHS